MINLAHGFWAFTDADFHKCISHTIGNSDERRDRTIYSMFQINASTRITDPATEQNQHFTNQHNEFVIWRVLYGRLSEGLVAIEESLLKSTDTSNSHQAINEAIQEIRKLFPKQP